MNFIILLFVSLFSSAAPELMDGIYATVNDEMITKGDVDSYQTRLKKGFAFETMLFTDEKIINMALKDKKFLLERMIAEKLIDSEAKKLGVNVTDDRIAKDIQNQGGEAHLTEILKGQGFTFKEYKEYLKKSAARKEVINHFVGGKVKISDDDIMDFYVTQTKGASTGQGFEFDLSHILFPFDNAKEKVMAAEAAQKALAALQQGQSFTSLHSKYNPREKDDAFGVFKSGDMLPAIENAVGKMRSGDTSQVVETPLGFHIFRLNKKKVVNNPDFEKRRAQIFNILMAKNYNEQLDYWLNQKRKSSIVKVIGEKK